MKSSTNFLATLLSALAAVSLLSSCATTTSANKKHEYIYDDEEEEVSNQPWVRPSNTFDGGGLSNMPQSR